MRWRLGFDIGGTFTDFVLQRVDTGAVVVGKHLTTPKDPADGVLRGLEALLERAGAGLSEVELAVHGTTLGANLVIERKGARTFLITTDGFRDVLEIQRQLRYNINDLFVDKHPPLIPRDQIAEVGERIRADGSVHRRLDAAEVAAVLARCRDAGAESLAVGFLHSYANPEHEAAVAALAAEHLPGVPVTGSADVSPQYREYERITTSRARWWSRSTARRGRESTGSSTRWRRRGGRSSPPPGSPGSGCSAGASRCGTRGRVTS
jgi:N-methylhydantoinase A/oxoprolinase/acetone carboxylase beta subunit